MKKFREFHLLQILSSYEEQSFPLDLFIHQYFKTHKSLGSKDRHFISETIFQLIRWKGLIDYLLKRDISWEKRFEFLTHFNPEDYRNDNEIPLSIRLSFPKELFNFISSSYGLEQAALICRTSNTQAPLTIRTNSLKTNRNELISFLTAKGYLVKACLSSPLGIQFNQREALFSLPEFSKGYFEVQDEASQLIASLVQPVPGEKVMDFCAGSGGKTLAFAPSMQNTGQIFLHDIRKGALLEGRRRLKRAGIQNAQFVHAADEEKLKKLKKKMDWVIVDVPCSGTGTLRRNADMKWRFKNENFHKLIGQQRTIFEKALSFLAEDGSIVYATCSILNEENEQQVEHFLKTYPLRVVGTSFKSLPQEGGMDGFFGVTFKKL